jgi:hypothetical protein
MATASTTSRERIEQLKEVVDRNPSQGVRNRDEILDLLLSPDPYVREVAARALVQPTVEQPFAFQSRVGTLLTRLDDTNGTVRVNIQLVVGHLAQWYPQDFAPATELLVDSIKMDDPYEKLASMTALVQIARQRPDVVSPRKDALEELKAIRDGKIRENSPADAPTIDTKSLNEAIAALEGGDLASRPLEDDLAPIGRKTRLSKPARYGLLSLLWFPFAVIGFILVAVLIARMFLQNGNRQQQQRQRQPSRLGGIRYLWDRPKGVLYLRRSLFPTPSSLIPQLPGKTVISYDRTAETPAKPGNWDQICTAVYNRDGGICRNCQIDIEQASRTDGYVDFKVPHEKKGEPHPSNLRVLCGDCHDARSGGH